MKKFDVTAKSIKSGLFSFSGFCESEGDSFYKKAVRFQKCVHGDFVILSASFSNTEGLVQLSGMLWAASGWESDYTDCLGSIYCKDSEVAKKVLATEPFSNGGYGINGWFDAPEPSMKVIPIQEALGSIVIDVVEGEFVYDGAQSTYIMDYNEAAYDYCLEHGLGLKRKFIVLQNDTLFPEEGFDYAIYESAEIALKAKGEKYQVLGCYEVTGSKMNQDEFYSLLMSEGIDAYTQAEKWRDVLRDLSPKTQRKGITDLCDCTICELETTCQISGWNAEKEVIEYSEFDNKLGTEEKKSIELDYATLPFIKGVYRYVNPDWDC